MFKLGHPVRVIDIRPEACCDGKVGIVCKIEDSEFGACYVVRTDHLCDVRYYDRETSLRHNFEDICTIVQSEILEDSLSGAEPPSEPTLDPEIEMALGTLETEAPSDGWLEPSRTVNCAICSRWFQLERDYLSYGEKMVPPDPILYACPSCISLYGEPSVMLQLQDRWLACTSSTASDIPIADIPDD